MQERRCGCFEASLSCREVARLSILDDRIEPENSMHPEDGIHPEDTILPDDSIEPEGAAQGRAEHTEPSIQSENP